MLAMEAERFVAGGGGGRRTCCGVGVVRKGVRGTWSAWDKGGRRVQVWPPLWGLCVCARCTINEG